MENSNSHVYYMTVFDEVGRTKFMLPKPDVFNGLDISSFSPGTYTIQLMDDETKSVATRKFIKQ
jgi:hypothetical protein